MAADTKKLRDMSVAELRAKAADIRKDFATLQEGTRDDGYDGAARALFEEIQAIDLHITAAGIIEAQEGARSAGLWLPPTAGGYGVGTDAYAGVRSAGQQVTENDDYADWMRRGANGNSPVITLEGGIRAPIFEFAAGGPGNAATTGTTTLLPVGQPIAPTPRRARLFMRDLIPTQRTGLATIPYVRERTPTTTEGGATTVPEGAVKPDQSLGFDGAQAPITVIAANMTVSKQIFEDATTVVDYINGRLPYLVQFREDAEILAGSGTWPDILGILHTPGRQSQNSTGDSAITLGQACALIENADGEATACVMNPTDAWNMFTLRASTSGIFDAGSPFSMSMTDALSVWGLPVKRSRVFAPGNSLVGDFAMGAILFDREQVNVQTYPQHADYPVRNQVLIQAEERVGLAVTRPDLFVEASLDATAGTVPPAV